MRDKHMKQKRGAGRFTSKNTSFLGGLLLACTIPVSYAYAQSNVTVYGNLDVAINKESNAALKMDRGLPRYRYFQRA